MSQFDWKNFESVLFAAVLDAATQLMERHKGTFYAFAFHEFYAETDGPIHLPCFAAGTEEYLAGNEDGRWDSASWRWTQIKYATPELRELHRAVGKLAVEKDEAHWERTYRRFIDSFVAVTKKLSPQLSKQPRAGKDFVAVVLTEDDTAENLKRCLTPRQFAKHFADLKKEAEVARKLESSPPAVKVAKFLDDLHRHEEELFRLGPEAIPFLCDVLESDHENASVAADLVRDIAFAYKLFGNVDPRAARILKKRFATGKEVMWHDAEALAQLGEVEFLLEGAKKAKTREIAIRGICELYKEPYSRRSTWPLDYRPMERLMEIPGCKVKQLYSGNLEIAATDIDEALRGLESKHAAIREHAICTLGNRKLGAKNADRILPAIVARLQDRSAKARHLAILALRDWKEAGKRYMSEVRKLTSDKDETVADFAKMFASGKLY